MTQIPSLIFTKDAELIGENLVLKNKPEFYSLKELESAFFNALSREDTLSFIKFCNIKCEVTKNSRDFRIYKLINFHPYRFAMIEKCKIGENTENVAFISDDVSKFHMIMSPNSSVIRDISYELIHGLLFLGDKGSGGSYLTPEALLAIRHLPGVTDELTSETKRVAYCDLCKLIDLVSTSFANRHCYSDVTFDIIRDECIVEVSPPPLVYVLSSVYAILYALSGDRVIHVDSHKFAYAGEITVSTKMTQENRINSDSVCLADLCEGLPSLIGISQSAAVVAHLFDILLFVSVDGTAVTVTIGTGFEYQAEPDFKYSDPYSVIPLLTKEITDLFEIL